MTDEIFKPIPGFPGYEVSNLGTVRSLKRKHTRTLKPYTSPKGYLRLNLYNNGKDVRRKVHQLVMLAFVGPCPDGLEVCHGQSGKANNRLDNLRYDTHLANMKDLFLIGQGYKIAKEIREDHFQGKSPRKLAEKYNFSKSYICRIVKGKQLIQAGGPIKGIDY